MLLQNFKKNKITCIAIFLTCICAFTSCNHEADPVVNTGNVSAITCTSAICGGYVMDNGASVSVRGVCYNTDGHPDINDYHTTDGSGSGVFTSHLTGLTPNTTYYVRAYAGNSNGLFYGEELSFTTNSDGDTPDDPDIPAGALAGLFSISPSQQVRFSQGNLQYQASTNTWRFAANQWDCIGSANSNISPSYDGWIDLFGWGTSGCNDKHPWMTSEMQTDYGDNQNNISNTNYDWGKYNPISNGGGQAGLWRTPSSSELNYMIYHRPNAENLYSMGLINGWHGLIILPDACVLPNGVSFTPAYKQFTNDVNSYTLEEWALLEGVGAVFLPVAGVRKGTSVSEVDESGYYWSTDILTPESGAKEMWFGRMYIYYNPGIGGSFDRSKGISVRLVADVINK